MRTTRAGALAAGVCCAVLAVACTGGDPAHEADDDAEVLGIQVERDGEDVATFEPTEPTELVSPSPAPVDEPTGAPSPAVTGDAPTAEAPREEPAPQEAPPRPDPSPAAPAPGPRPDPSPSPSPAPSPTAEPVALTTRDGHSYVTWFRDEEPDGQGGSRYVWGEVSAAPTVTRDGSEPLRVTLVDLANEPDRSAPRRAQCRSWLEVDGDRPVTARGDVTVEVVVDGEVVSYGTRAVDVRVEPGERRDLVDIGDVRVAVPDVAEVTCRVRFTAEAGG